MGVVRCLSSVLVCGLLLSGFAQAAELEFDFKDPKGVNSVVFVLDSMLEPIMGVAQGISGKVTFDPADPKRFSGRLRVDAAEIKCASSRMTEVLHSEDWIDVKKYPSIEFSFKEVRQAKRTGENTTKMLVVVDVTCKGVTKEMTVPVSATFLANRMGDRMRRSEGDLLVLRSTFTLRRKDFGIKPEMGSTVVAEEIELRVSIVGGAKKK